MIAKATRTKDDAIDSGGFVARANFPGHLVPGREDHGLGPLATIMESFLAPGTHIALHEHVQDEIVSWVPAGVMRHDDPAGGPLTVDADHLMIMNSGRGFRHEERTREGDPPLRMLQIFVRPDRADLEPRIQHGRLAEPEPDAWRHLFGPVDGAAPFEVRNAVHGYDVRLRRAARAWLPTRPGWRTYFYVFEGRVTADGGWFGEGESGLIGDGERVAIRAEEPALVLAFVIDPRAAVCRGGTVGDGETVHAMAERAARAAA